MSVWDDIADSREEAENLSGVAVAGIETEQVVEQPDRGVVVLRS